MNFHLGKLSFHGSGKQSTKPAKMSPATGEHKESVGSRIMAVFSKLSKAFLLPIALLPIAGVFLGVGAAITSNTDIGTGIWYFGNVLNKMGDVAFGNLPILFAISTALAFSKDAGVAAITAVVGFLVMNGIQAALLHNQIVGDPQIAYAYINGKDTYVNLLANKNIDVTQAWQFYHVGGDFSKSVGEDALPDLIKNATRVDLGGNKLDASGKAYFALLFAKNIPNGLITSNIGVQSLNTGVFAAIFVGAVSAWAYNRFHKTQLPSAISFFSGTKLVPIITFFLVIPLSIIFILAWPWIGIGLAKFGELSGTLPVGLDSFIYEIVERSLVPFGLHHVFYAPLWWTNAGGSISETLTNVKATWASDASATFGHSVIGGHWDLARWVTEYKLAFPDVIVKGNSPIDQFNDIISNLSKYSDLWGAQGDQTMMYKVIAHLDVINFTMLEHLGMNLGRFQSGKFGFMLLGLPLASLAMWLNVPKQNRAKVMGIYLSAAFTCFLTGITEPIEYTFLFLAPWLFYGVHMPLAAISFMLAGFLQTHVTMTVSGGAIDYIVFGLVPFFGSHAMTWLSVFGVLFVSLGMAGLYFVSFYFAVKYGKVMVPGRAVDGGETKLFTKADFKAKGKEGDAVTISIGTSYTKSTNPAEISKYEKAAKIIEYLGGEENITNVDSCASRLRVNVVNGDKVEKDKIIALGGATGALVKGSNIQVVYGGEQEAIKPRMLEILKIQRDNPNLVKVGATVSASAAIKLQASAGSEMIYTKSTNPAEISKYEKAAKIIEYLGGEENITNVDACASRLRVNVINGDKVEKDKIIALGGATGALVKGSNIQVVYGGEQEAIKPRMLEILAIQRAMPKTAKAELTPEPTILEAKTQAQAIIAETVPAPKAPIYSSVVYLTTDMMATCPNCDQQFKVALLEEHENGEEHQAHHEIVKKAKPAKTAPKKTTKAKPVAKTTKVNKTKVIKHVIELETKYGQILANHVESHPDWISNMTSVAIEERALKDGSHDIEETRQALQKNATELRTIAKTEHKALTGNVNLRNLTKAEVLRYLRDLVEIINN